MVIEERWKKQISGKPSDNAHPQIAHCAQPQVETGNFSPLVVICVLLGRANWQYLSIIPPLPAPHGRCKRRKGVSHKTTQKLEVSIMKPALVVMISH